MFKQIVANLSFSPQATSQLSFYLRRLRKEDFTRKMSASAAILAFSFQLLAVFAPATPTIASSTNDIVFGGLDRKNPKKDMLEIYDQDHDSKGNTGYQKLFSHFGITRKNIANTELKTIHSGSSQDEEFWRSLGRNPHSNLDKRVEVGQKVYWLRPLWTWGQNLKYPALVGKRDDGTPFAIMVDCGNIAIKDKIKVARTLKCINLKTSKTKGEAPLRVTLTAHAEAENQRIKQYRFHFGDGEVKESKDKTAEYRYKEPGKYTAYVIVVGEYDRTERKAACSVDINVKAVATPPPAEEPTISCVDLDATPVSGQGPLSVNFTAQATVTKQQVDKYIFNFGDGTSKEHDQNTIEHTYNAPGDYTATLAVTGTIDKEPVTSENCQVSITVLPPVTPGGSPDIQLSKSAVNLNVIGGDGQPANAHNTTATAGQTIQYTLVTKNVGSSTQQDYVVTENVRDIQEYADIIDLGGGSIHDGIITWPAADIAAGASLINSFRATIKNPIPSAPTSITDPNSFDLRMDNLYGNLVSVNLAAPGAKQLEAAATSLPQTGPELAILTMLGFAAVVVYFYFRNKQLVYELEILRQDHNGNGGNQ